MVMETHHGWWQCVKVQKRMLPPTNRRQLRRFLGMVNYYRDVWKHRSHIIAPLAKLSGQSKAKFAWTEVEQKAFEATKAMIARETLLAYPDFNQTFHVFTDASDYQLGRVSGCMRLLQYKWVRMGATSQPSDVLVSQVGTRSQIHRHQGRQR